MSRLIGKDQNRKTFLANRHLKRAVVLYKTQKSLERHRRMKHQHCAEELSNLITRSCEKITADQCFPPSTSQAFDNFKVTDRETENIF